MAVTVTITKNMKFDPNPVNVKKGDSVIWKNDAGHTHTATADDGGVPDTGEIDPGASSSPQTFNDAGTVKYHCDIHPSMKGSVVVS